MFYLKLYGSAAIGQPAGEIQIGRGFPSAGEALEEAHAAGKNDGFGFGKAMRYRIHDVHGDLVQEGAL